MDINKEFEEWERSLIAKCGGPIHSYSAKLGYIAAAAPRDLLIEQLVKAQRELLTCLEGWTLDDESEKAIKRACAALSAAKARGYL